MNSMNSRIQQESNYRKFVDEKDYSSEEDASNDKNEFQVGASLTTDGDVLICLGGWPQKVDWATKYKHCEREVRMHYQDSELPETKQCILIYMRAPMSNVVERQIYKNLFDQQFKKVYWCKLKPAQYGIFNDDESKQEDKKLKVDDESKQEEKKLNVDDSSNKKFFEFLKLLPHDDDSKQDMMVTKEQEKIEWETSKNDIALQKALKEFKEEKEKLQDLERYLQQLEIQKAVLERERERDGWKKKTFVDYVYDFYCGVCAYDVAGCDL